MWQEMKSMSQKDQLCIVVRHDDIKAGNDHIKLHAVKRYFRVTMEGDPDLFFDVAPTTDNGKANEAQTPLPTAIDEAINGHSEEVNTIEALQGIVEIDDDNEPAEENFPATTATTNRILSTEWGHDGFCFRKSQNFGNTRAKLNFAVDPTTQGYYIQLFEGLFPKQLLLCIIEIINEKMDGEDDVTYGEFLRWIGIWVLMSTVDGADRRTFWSTKTVDAFEGAPFRLTPFMSCRRFEKILNNLRYTKEEVPEFRDRFWEVQSMTKMWNNNMGANFLPSWINCINESMSKWVNEYTCPGFMYVPRKPWPFGNEYHDTGCADSDIIWALDLREGKDQPRNLGKKEFDEIGKTTGILLQLTKPFWSTEKVFVLDSGFCVLQASVELKKRGLFAAALIKNAGTGQNMYLAMRSLLTSMTKKWELLTQLREQWTALHSIFMESKSRIIL